MRHVATPGRLHLVWPGGLWDWLDPVCLVEAVARAREGGVVVTAELWGARSPDPLVPPSRAAQLVAERARELGITDAIEIVDWVAHDERRARLARADVAVTLDPGGIEARFAFRTRLVDALAAGLPDHRHDRRARRRRGRESRCRVHGARLQARGTRPPSARARRRPCAARSRSCARPHGGVALGLRADSCAARCLVS